MQALLDLQRRPRAAVGALVDQLTAEILPWLHAREELSGARALYLELSEVAEALTIVALRPAFARAAARDLRLGRTQIDRLPALIVGLAAIEALSGTADHRAQAEDQARAALYFVAEADRPQTEAHVLRHQPRPPRVWSPTRVETEGSALA